MYTLEGVSSVANIITAIIQRIMSGHINGMTTRYITWLLAPNGMTPTVTKICFLFQTFNIYRNKIEFTS